ncbi:hypothetical protein JW905_05585 [bacterium]|nr:hypothetical protein [candidate division CSSED10-310 bacterium]
MNPTTLNWEDAPAFPLLILFCLAIYRAAHLWTASSLEKREDRLLSIPVLWFSGVLLVVLMAGVPGHLDLFTMSALIGVLVLGTEVFLRWRGALSTTAPGCAVSHRSPMGWLDLSLLLFLCGALVTVITKTIGDGPAGWDVWTYHLAFPADWLLSHDLRTMLQHYGDSAPPYYPLNAGMWAFWWMAPLRSDLLAPFAQLPFLVAGMIGLFSAARQLDCSPKDAWTGALAFGTMPFAIGMSGIAYNDLTMAGCFGLAFAAVLMHHRRPSAFNAMIAGLAIGMFVGVKYSSVPFSLVLLAPAGFTLLRATSRLPGIAAFSTGLIATGGFTYLRNAIITGNPIYPAHVELFGRVIIAGAYSSRVFVGSGMHEADLAHMLFSRSGLTEVGWQTPVLFIPAVILAPLLVIMTSRGHTMERWISRLYAAVSPLLVFMVYYWLVPYRYNARFFFPALLASGLAVALASHCLGKWRFVVPIALLGAVWSNTYHCLALPGRPAFHRYLLAGALVLGAVAKMGDAYVPRRLRGFYLWRTKLAVAGSLVILLIAAAAGAVVLPEYARHKWDYITGDLSGVMEWLMEMGTYKSLRIAYAGSNAPYPYFGARLRNMPVFVPRNATGAAPYYGCGYVHGDIMSNPEYSAWHRNITALAVDYLITTRHNRSSYPPEDTWARTAGLPTAFVNDSFHVFAVSEWARRYVL